MKRLFIPFLGALCVGMLSCSKPTAPPSTQLPPTPVSIAPTAAPSSGAIPIDLGSAPTPEPLEYVLEDLKGTVLIRESGQTQAEPAQEEETVEEGDEIITKAGSEASLTLDENTMFHLSENSDVKVDQLKPNLSNGFINRLLLLGGKVLSEVEKLADSHSTFEVESGGVVCGVRGTAFEVFTQGGAVHTLTYHGEVEMHKGGLVQAVVAGHASAFLLKKGTFQPPRPLRAAEQQHYQNWLRKKAVVQKKQAQRLAAMRRLSQLTPAQRSQMREKLKGVPPKDRMRMMRRVLKSEAAHPGREERLGNRGKLRPGQGKQGRGQLLRRNQALPHKAAGPMRQGGELKGRPASKLRGQKSLRPQGQKARPALRPNRPHPTKPQNHPGLRHKKAKLQPLHSPQKGNPKEEKKKKKRNKN